MLKTRKFPESNYSAVYVNGKTIRVPLDFKREISPIEYPEFYDVKITNRCNGGCSYCYQNSVPSDKDYENIPEKIDNFFGSLTTNQRPFQVAIGGGEPTLHPEFEEICKRFKALGIDPNYTTNGTALTDKVLDITEKYVNGVAVSCHPHLKWRNGVEKLLARGIYTNLHIIISDEDSVERFKEIYKEYHGRIKYFVLLPLINQGRATEQFNAWAPLKEFVESLANSTDIAYGALFHPYLKDLNCNISIYEPEAFSRYLVMDDEMKTYPSSFLTD